MIHFQSFRIDLVGLCILSLVLTACQPVASPIPTQQAGVTASASLPTQTLTLSPSPSTTATVTPTVTPTSTSTVTATITPTPWSLEQFDSPILRPDIVPAGYLADPCDYLGWRWQDGKAEPGTVVVPVMFHSIVQPPSQVTDPKDITVDAFRAFVDYALSLGFETITTQELVDFLLHNDYIPPRSMLLIVDDRRPGLIFEHFMPVLEANDWTVTPAYIADPDSLAWAWEWMERLNESGRLDVQSHGTTGQLYVLPETPLEQIQHEVWESTAVLEAHFGKRPSAFIWPGGNFTPLAVQVAREGDYQLGFTAYSRGPLLFNWIPLGEEERLVEDPLMVLPRAWSSSVNYNLYEALQISEQAAAFAAANAELEKAWMQAFCSGN